MALEVGDRIGDYQVLEILGAGGMGKVYKVRNTISERVEAMKVLLPNLESDPELADRFMREIKVQASLEHPNIAALHTALRIDNQLLMIMEYVEGRTIEAMLHDGPLALGPGLDYVSQVLSALAYAHARGVVHRDIKPANMMLTPGGVVKLMDFGIAKMAEDRKLTQTGRTVGSLYYMSPEQIQGATLDGRSDLYSLGVSLYEIVTGRRPFQGDSDYSIMAAHLQQTPVPPLQLDPKLPAALNEVILLSITKDPAQRFQSADAFRAAIESVRQQVGGAAPAKVAAAPAPASPPPPKAAGSHRGLYIAIGSLATVAVLVLAAMQLPKWMGTKANAPAPAVSAQMAQTASTTTAVPQVPATPPAEATAAPPAPPAAMPSESNAPQAARTSSRRPAAALAQAPPPEQAIQPPPTAPAPMPTPAAPADDPARMQALNDLRDRMMLMAARISAVKASIQTMQREQAQQGLGMRGDIVSSNQRLDYLMDETEAALRSGHPAAAKKTLNGAERELDKLERFLGR